MDPLIPTGSPAPDFSLPDLKGKMVSLGDFHGQIVVLNFWSAECPHVARTDAELQRSIQGWSGQVVLLPIACNLNEPLELVHRVAAERGLDPVLIDQNLQVTNLYGAQTTPHYFVIDSQGVLLYQGSSDDVTFRQRTPEHFYLLDAIEAILAGKQPEKPETSPYGCSIVRYK